jgi:hypothetical protein
MFDKLRSSIGCVVRRPLAGHRARRGVARQHHYLAPVGSVLLQLRDVAEAPRSSSPPSLSPGCLMSQRRSRHSSALKRRSSARPAAVPCIFDRGSRSRVPDGLLRDPRPRAEGTGRRRRVPGVAPPARRVLSTFQEWRDRHAARRCKEARGDARGQGKSVPPREATFSRRLVERHGSSRAAHYGRVRKPSLRPLHGPRSRYTSPLRPPPVISAYWPVPRTTFQAPVPT